VVSPRRRAVLERRVRVLNLLTTELNPPHAGRDNLTSDAIGGHPGNALRGLPAWLFRSDGAFRSSPGPTRTGSTPASRSSSTPTSATPTGSPPTRSAPCPGPHPPATTASPWAGPSWHRSSANPCPTWSPLQRGPNPSSRARALPELGRVIKTLHVLEYCHDPAYRRAIHRMLNRGETRNSLARDVFHSQRGHLRKHYQVGQEQLDTLGIMVNIIIPWQTVYTQAALHPPQGSGRYASTRDGGAQDPVPILVTGHRVPCMWAATALRGAPASIRCTERRARPSTSAALTRPRRPRRPRHRSAAPRQGRRWRRGPSSGPGWRVSVMGRGRRR